MKQEVEYKSLITHFSFEAKWVIKFPEKLAGRFKDIVNSLS